MEILNIPDLKDSNGLWLKSYTRDGMRYRTRGEYVWLKMNQRSQHNPHPRLARWVDVCCDFTDFQEFVTWCQGQYGYMNKDMSGKFWHLDKDIIKPGNRSYSAETCCFVPGELNSVVTLSNRSRGDYPIGVDFKNGKYRSRVSVDGKSMFMGYYNTPYEAHQKWQEEKIKSLEYYAIKYAYLPELVIKGLLMRVNKIKIDIEEGQETLSF